MKQLKLSTLTLALLGAIALTACDNTTDTAAVDTYEPDATAADTQPIDNTAPVAGVPEPTATDEYGTTDSTATMGNVDELDESDDLGTGDLDETDLGDDETEMLDPTEPDPMDPYPEDQVDPTDPVDEAEPPS